MGQLPPVSFECALEMVRLAVLDGVNVRAAVDDVRHGPHLLRVSAKADGADDVPLRIPVRDDGVGIGGQAHARLRVIIGQLDQVAL